MQKKFFGLTVLLLFVAGGMFAQELKFDGYINSGVGVVITDQDGADPTFKAAANDAEQNGYRFRLNGSYTNEAKNAGAKFRFQSQASFPASGGTGYFTLPYAFGWISFLDNMLTLNAGIVEDNTWSTGDFWLASGSVSDFTGLGALLKVTPIDGLALGIGGYALRRGASNNSLSSSNFGTPVNLGDVKWTFHGAYTMKDVFRLGVSYRTENEAGDAETGKLYGEFRYLGMKDLTAVVAASVDRLGMDDFDTAGVITISETFGYKIDLLNLGLNAVEFLYTADGRDPAFLFNLWVSYTMDSIVPRLDLVYFMNGQSSGNWFRHGFAAAADKNVFSAKPSVKINLDSRTFLEIGDMINYDFSDNAVYDGDKARITNSFYVDLKWSF